MAMAGYETIILESERIAGDGTSSRNSEVIHAGIYYPSGSAKAELCVRGKELLYDYVASHNLPHQRLGKLLVATDEKQLGKLAQLEQQARNNGVFDLEEMTRLQVAELEPSVSCIAALFSPSTGIIDSHGLMHALLGDAESHGAMIAYCTPVTRVSPGSDGGLVVSTGGDQPFDLATRWFINSTGLHASKVAHHIEGLAPEFVPETRYAKGNYYSLAGTKNPFHHLIYPMPDTHGLGVHVTIDLGGQARFGPDVEWVDSVQYTVDPSRADSFYEAIRSYWPDLPNGALVPAYSGIRPKITGVEGSQPDFVIQGPDDHGLPGVINLFGIESPGLTASLAIAERVTAVVFGRAPPISAQAPTTPSGHD
jgi:L-2-hydroxyglutarate oxidase LhgO